MRREVVAETYLERSQSVRLSLHAHKTPGFKDRDCLQTTQKRTCKSSLGGLRRFNNEQQGAAAKSTNHVSKYTYVVEEETFRSQERKRG